MNDKVRAWIVDDDQLIQATVEDVLFEGGFDPVLTDSGEEAIALLKDERTQSGPYFDFIDYSRSAHYAGGLSEDEIARQQREADRLNKRFGKDFRILKGIESDILADGSLDYPDDVLGWFDFVPASMADRPQGADAAPAAGQQSSHDRHRPYDRAAAPAPAEATNSTSRRCCGPARSMTLSSRSTSIHGAEISTGAGIKPPSNSAV